MLPKAHGAVIRAPLGYCSRQLHQETLPVWEPGWEHMGRQASLDLGSGKSVEAPSYKFLKGLVHFQQLNGRFELNSMWKKAHKAVTWCLRRKASQLRSREECLFYGWLAVWVIWSLYNYKAVGFFCEILNKKLLIHEWHSYVICHWQLFLKEFLKKQYGNRVQLMVKYT